MTAATHGMPSIESVDAFARQLYRHTRDAGTEFVDLAIAVRNLRTALQHLGSEAHDQDSPLHQRDSGDSVYARQLTSLVEDSDFALKQAGTTLARYGPSDSDLEAGVARRDSDLAERARRIDLIRGDIISQTLKIDIFLDTIQLHNPAKTQRVLDNNMDDQQMDAIKNKVDAVARRLYWERKDQVEMDEDELWRSFKSELEREGFSPEVLRKNKEVLRAYIRELESHQPLGGGTPPSVRGLLEWDAQPPMPVASGLYPIRDKRSRLNSDTGPLSNERRRRASTPERQHGALSISPRPRSPDAFRFPPQLSFELETSSESSGAEASPSSHTALISTRDLMALDRYSADKVAALTGNSLLLPIPSPFHVISPGTLPNTRYLPHGTQPLSIPSHGAQPAGLAYPGALPSGLSPTAYGSSLTISSSDAGWDLATLPASAPAAGNDMPKNPALPRQSSNLAPDSKGQTIPLDATWTRIDRKLVSPEVLEKYRVRYEARPNFVAVLGVLTREQIEKYARESYEVRKARNPSPTTKRTEQNSPRYETYGDSYRRTRPRDSARDDGGSEASDSDSSSSPSSSDDDGRRAAGRSSTHCRRSTPKDRAAHRSSKHLDSEDDERVTSTNKGRPVIVSPPASVSGDSHSLSPSSTVAPKPILKNKNPNHVRFDRSGPREISPPGHHHRDHHYPERSPRREPREQRDRPREHYHHHRDRERDRPRERDRDRDRDRDNKTRRDRSRERSRERSERVIRDEDRDRVTAAKDRDTKDRERDRDRDLDHRVSSSSKRHPDRDRDRDRERERERDRERDRERERERDRDRDNKDRDRDRDRDPRGGRAEEGRQAGRRSALKEAAGAIGVSGAAATLLSVLTGAAAHL
ncbi:hypothetical protein N658DRAFT_561744 [Parathielavia hyrcaniae]|uniref:DUF8035 domain-containing protein n=1 Tax=Parathielavia hyrcaniae TaxID=113614 RepID=A0AAN6SYB4_9PEZI|nr:hypothetical protein N658DRAFT_561744 [Parathielavia hyrcaniae]